MNLKVKILMQKVIYTLALALIVFGPLFTVKANACGWFYGETPIPEELQD